MSGEITTKSETLGQRAYREIRQQIIQGEFRPGERLPLRSVAKSLGMSMAPVSEALRDLGRDGLIEHEAGVGARVRKLDVEGLRNQHILRIAVECEAVRQATERATDGHLADLRDLAEKLDRVIDSNGPPQDVHRLDSRFHLRIAQLSGSSSLVETLQANQLVRLLGRGSRLAHDMKQPHAQHLRIVAPILSRDTDAAERAMREHCQVSMELQLRYAAVQDLE
jgi:DNA-binding GntR family transcriptional regulator